MQQPCPIMDYIVGYDFINLHRSLLLVGVQRGDDFSLSLSLIQLVFEGPVEGPVPMISTLKSTLWICNKSLLFFVLVIFSLLSVGLSLMGRRKILNYFCFG